MAKSTSTSATSTTSESISKPFVSVDSAASSADTQEPRIMGNPPPPIPERPAPPAPGGGPGGGVPSIVPKECEGGSSGGIIKRSVPTGDVLTAALSRLNRVSLEKLLDELVVAINGCCEDDGLPPDFPSNEVWYKKIIENIDITIANLKKVQVEIDTKIDENNTYIWINDYSVKVDQKISTNNTLIYNDFSTRIWNDFSTRIDQKITTNVNNLWVTDYSVRVDQKITTNNTSIFNDFSVRMWNDFSTKIDQKITNTWNNDFSVKVDQKITTNNTNIFNDFSVRMWNDFSTKIDQKFNTTYVTNIDTNIDQKINNFTQNIFNVKVEEITTRLQNILVLIGDFFDKKGPDNSLIYILNQITNINLELEGHDKNITNFEQYINIINKQIIDIYSKLNIDGPQLMLYINNINTKITEMEANIKLIIEHPPVEVIKQTVIEILSTTNYSTQIFNSVSIDINNTRKTLVEILNILATVDYVAEVQITYDDNDIAGCKYIMVDGCVYDFKARFQNVGPDTFTYIFDANWNGLPARFTSTYRQVTKKWTVCKKDVSYSSYEPVSNTNIVFSLV